MGFGELIFIMLFALILFGPEDLPRVARAVGKTVYELRNATGVVTKEFEKYVQTAENVKTDVTNRIQVDQSTAVTVSDNDSQNTDDVVQEKSS